MLRQHCRPVNCGFTDSGEKTGIESLEVCNRLGRPTGHTAGLEGLLRPAPGPPRRLRSGPGRRRMVRDRRADLRVGPAAPGVPRRRRTPVVCVPLRARDQVFERGCGPGEPEFQLGDPLFGSGRFDRDRTSSTANCSQEGRGRPEEIIRSSFQSGKPPSRCNGRLVREIRTATREPEPLGHRCYHHAIKILRR